MYSFSEYMTPLWTGERVSQESVLFVSDGDGNVPAARLLYNIETVESVMSADTLTLYEQGRDYTICNGELVLTSSTRIPVWSYNDYYPQEEIKDKCFNRTGGGYIAFGEGDFMHRRQIVVTYTHKDAWGGPIPQSCLNRLPRTAEMLKSGSELTVLFYGDSITTGANSSSVILRPPYAPDWCELTVEALRREYGCSIRKINTAVGGTVSHWGAQNAYERAASCLPDLAFIAFGANDISTEPEVFAANIADIVNTLRLSKPECEFVFIAPWQTNKEVKGFWGNQYMFEDALTSLSEKITGSCVAPVWSVHSYMLTRKQYRDMCGNNVNHPNDFAARMYAQIMLALLK